jgi:ribose/xylose/arabinose/galactoside ABC-type transport system permease subunit
MGITRGTAVAGLEESIQAGAAVPQLARQPADVLNFPAAVLAFVVLSFASDVFATQQNLFNVTRNFAFVAIIAIGMTAVIVSGGIDLRSARCWCCRAW